MVGGQASQKPVLDSDLGYPEAHVSPQEETSSRIKTDSSGTPLMQRAMNQQDGPELSCSTLTVKLGTCEDLNKALGHYHAQRWWREPCGWKVLGYHKGKIHDPIYSGFLEACEYSSLPLKRKGGDKRQ